MSVETVVEVGNEVGNLARKNLFMLVPQDDPLPAWDKYFRYCVGAVEYEFAPGLDCGIITYLRGWETESGMGYRVLRTMLNTPNPHRFNLEVLQKDGSLGHVIPLVINPEKMVLVSNADMDQSDQGIAWELYLREKKE